MGVFYIQKPKKLKTPPPPLKAPPKPKSAKPKADKLKTKKKRKSNRGTDKRYNPYGQGSSANPSNMSAGSGG